MKLRGSGPNVEPQHARIGTSRKRGEGDHQTNDVVGGRTPTYGLAGHQRTGLLPKNWKVPFFRRAHRHDDCETSILQQ